MSHLVRGRSDTKRLAVGRGDVYKLRHALFDNFEPSPNVTQRYAAQQPHGA